MALRNWSVHLNAFFNPDHANGLPAIIGTSGSTLDPVAVTETDPTPWYDQLGSGSYGGPGPSNVLRSSDCWVEVPNSLHPTYRPPTCSTPGNTSNVEVEPLWLNFFSHQVLPSLPPTPVQEVHSSVVTGHEPPPPSSPSCPCNPAAIFQSCLELQQHLVEASHSENMSGACTCFATYGFLAKYGTMMVVRTCPLILEHLAAMVSLSYRFG